MKICILFGLLFTFFYTEGQIHLDINVCRRMIFEQFEKITPQGINIKSPTNQKNKELANFFKGENIHSINITDNQQNYSPIYLNPLEFAKRNVDYHEIDSDKYLKSFPQTTPLLSRQDENISLDNSIEFYRDNTSKVIEQVTLYSQEIDFLRKQYSLYEKIVEADIAYWELVYFTEIDALLQDYRQQIMEELEVAQDKNPITDVQKLQLKLSNIEKVWKDVIRDKYVATQNLCRILGFQITTSIMVDDSIKSTFNPRMTLLESVLLRRPEYNLYKKESYFQKEVQYLQDTLELTFNDIFSLYRKDNKLYNPEIDEELIWIAYNIYLHKPEYYYKNGRLEMHFDEHRKDSMNKQEIIRMINKEIEQASLNLEEAQKRVDIAYKIRNEVHEKMEFSRTNWKKGKTTVEKYLEDRTIWYYSWQDWVRAKQELKICETYYLRALGKLLKDI